MSDPVNKPAHYNAGEVETIDGIRSALGDGFADYCKGNVLKYVWRCGLKGDGVEDLRKAATYLEWAIEAMEGNCPVMPDSSDRKPLAIPAGWRELEPDEVPLATDMHEWMGGWYYRNDDATNEYKWHSSRHIRKIEPEEPKPLDIPEGWRELKHDEFPKVTDMYENEGAWRNRIDDSSFLYALYEVRHIRKIETANPSETPNSSTDHFGYFDDIEGVWVYEPNPFEGRKTEPKPTQWIPKVGDKVRVARYEGVLCGNTGVIKHTSNCMAWTLSENGGHAGWLRFEDLELIEAANPPESPDSSSGNPSETPNSSTWIPKVGDKVQVVCATPFPKEDRFGIVVKDNVRPRDDLFLVKTSNGIFSWFYTSELELIEAAS